MANALHKYDYCTHDEHTSVYNVLKELIHKYGLMDVLSAVHEIALDRYGECTLKDVQDKMAQEKGA